MAFVTPVMGHWLEREITQWVHHEGLIRWPITPWANALTTEVHLAPYTGLVPTYMGYVLWLLICYNFWVQCLTIAGCCVHNKRAWTFIWHKDVNFRHLTRQSFVGIHTSAIMIQNSIYRSDTELNLQDWYATIYKAMWNLIFKANAEISLKVFKMELIQISMYRIRVNLDLQG